MNKDTVMDINLPEVLAEVQAAFARCAAVAHNKCLLLLSTGRCMPCNKVFCWSLEYCKATWSVRWFIPTSACVFC